MCAKSLSQRRSLYLLEHLFVRQFENFNQFLKNNAENSSWPNKMELVGGPSKNIQDLQSFTAPWFTLNINQKADTKKLLSWHCKNLKTARGALPCNTTAIQTGQLIQGKLRESFRPSQTSQLNPSNAPFSSSSSFLRFLFLGNIPITSTPSDFILFLNISKQTYSILYIIVSIESIEILKFGTQIAIFAVDPSVKEGLHNCGQT